MRMSPALNESSEMQCFEHADAIEIHDGMFVFYTGLPHMYKQLHTYQSLTCIYTHCYNQCIFITILI